MILNECHIGKIQADIKRLPPIISDLIDTISAKDKQIQQLQQGFMPQLEEALKDKKYYRDAAKDMQERLDIAKQSLLECMACCRMPGVIERTVHEALEAIERSEK
jgi:hypothetical protein